MKHEYQRWYSHRVGREMGVNVYGHYGHPLLAFPTSSGDESELAGQSLIGALAHHVENGRIKIFCVGSVNNQSWYDKQAHPRHRSWLQAQYDDYIAREVVPFVRASCQTPEIPITSVGASFGAYHAVNTLLKHPDTFKRCFGLSGVYDIRKFMDGDYDDNFYFNNPVDYMTSLSDPWYLHHLASCDIRLVTGCGPWEDSGPTYRFSEVLKQRGIRHSVDDWGQDGGHDWPYWKRQMDAYVGGLY